MAITVGVLNVVLGSVYTSYGIMTIMDLRRGWKELGFSHFGLAWIAMAFTCGPHHLEHGYHLLFAGRAGGPLDLFVVIVGLPAGVIWFLLRVEALGGGRGERFVEGTPPWLRAMPMAIVAYGAVVVVWAAVTLGAADPQFGPRFTPNVLLLGLYVLIGYYLIRTQLANRDWSGGWSASGLALSFVFPTCGLMHAVFMLYGTTGRYDVDMHGLIIDWLAVPAAVYFVWVVRALHNGVFTDWNRAAIGVHPEPAVAP